MEWPGWLKCQQMCRNRSGLDELMVILDGKTMFATENVRVAGVLSL